MTRGGKKKGRGRGAGSSQGCGNGGGGGSGSADQQVKAAQDRQDKEDYKIHDSENLEMTRGGKKKGRGRGAGSSQGCGNGGGGGSGSADQQVKAAQDRQDKEDYKIHETENSEMARGGKKKGHDHGAGSSHGRGNGGGGKVVTGRVPPAVHVGARGATDHVPPAGQANVKVQDGLRGSGHEVGEGSNVKKRQGKKDYKIDDKEYSIFSKPAPTKTPSQLRNEACCLAAAYMVKSSYRLPPHPNFQDVHVFSVPARLSQEDLGLLYADIRSYTRNLFPFKISYTRDDGSRDNVPVTPMKESKIDKKRYFIVQIVGEEAYGRILVEIETLYTVAVQTVYHSGDKAENEEDVAWCFFNDVKGLGPLFKKKGKIKYYSCSYGQVESASVYDGLGEELISFYDTFRGETGLKQTYTEQGQLYFDTTIFLCSEPERFGVVEDFLVVVQGLIPAGIAKILRVWSKLSKCIFLLHLYLIEIRLAWHMRDEELRVIAASTARKVKQKWATAQFKIQDCGLEFFPRVESIVSGIVTLADGLTMEDVVLDEQLKKKLCGGQALNVLMQEPNLAYQIICRHMCFTGVF